MTDRMRLRIVRTRNPEFIKRTLLPELLSGERRRQVTRETCKILDTIALYELFELLSGKGGN